LYHVLTDWNRLYSGGRWWPTALEVWRGGLGIPGGIILGTIAGLITVWRLKVDARLALDAVAPSVPIAQAIGRFGNYFNQELFGRPTSVPWALRVDVIHRGDYPQFATFHPTFAYEALWNFGLAGLIVLGGRRVILRPGRWFAVYLAGYGIGRFWVELLRSDVASELFGVRVNTWVSSILLIIGLVWLFWGGSPVDHQATAELRAGGNPRAHAAERVVPVADTSPSSDEAAVSDASGPAERPQE
ncbi:MAG: prolipoprotein diacylglyceryl transferase, partial [Actinomycetes bacterium]